MCALGCVPELVVQWYSAGLCEVYDLLEHGSELSRIVQVGDWGVWNLVCVTISSCVRQL